MNKDGDLLASDCKEKNSNFVYKPHDHVHTSDLDLTENIPLRNIMKMAAKFKETPSCNKRKLIHLHWGASEKLTNKVARFAKSKSIIFYT